VEGKMQYVYDENGRTYLDAFGGIATVSCGHCHHDIIEAIVNQSRLLQHTTVLYLNHVVIDFAEALAAKMPGELKVSIFLSILLRCSKSAFWSSKLYPSTNFVLKFIK
jgi:alanine-glyoxylate transaminase/(R)-3-amino-2-methylpropionate-pyruvate transaminase